ncbi:hypothetical protein [Xanthobacter versatilis]|uniref:hypothetical protein n=1 Tax=Xanthobacter autotrophicus (strain ATCC BAA-1158 / Py2) TaxID=78245 RepID=UPI0037295F48
MSLPTSQPLPPSATQPQVTARFGAHFAPAFPVGARSAEFTWRKAPPATTKYISRDQAIKLYSSILFANYQGVVLNVELTIAWKVANIVSAKAVTQNLERFLDRFRKFMAHRNLSAFYYAVHENGKTLGYHTHLALHVPDRYRKDFHRWWHNIDNASDGSDGTESFMNARFHRDDSVHSQWRWFQYCMKGLDPRLMPKEKPINGQKNTDLNTLAGVWRRETGRVEMRRVLTSRSLGPDARSKAGYQPPFSFNRAPFEERYTDAEYKRGQSERMATKFPILEPC